MSDRPEEIARARRQGPRLLQQEGVNQQNPNRDQRKRQHQLLDYREVFKAQDRGSRGAKAL